MLLHALSIVQEEFNRHIATQYNDESYCKLEIGNIADVLSERSQDRNKIYLSIVNIREEKILKNVQHRAVSTLSMKVNYERPPVFVNFLVMLSAPHTEYRNALLAIARTIIFFQLNNVFTQDTVEQASINKQVTDRLETFKLIFDLYSPSLEEVNHLWGTLGGKQYPFVLYMLRMLDLKFNKIDEKDEVVKEIVGNFSIKR